MADVKISALPASTTPLAGTEVLPIVQSGSTVQVSVANLTAGRAVSALSLTSTTTLGVTGTSTLSGNAIISVTDNTNAALRITQLGTGNALVVEDSTSTDATPFVINTSGQVGLGIGGTSIPGGASIYVTSDGTAYYDTILVRAGDNAGAQTLDFRKTRGTVAAPASVSNADTLANIVFRGYDGTGNIQSASIQAYVDGTPGTNDMPGRLVFSTTADGAATPTERMRISSAGIVTMSAYGAGAATFSAAGVISSVSDETYKIKDGVIADPIPMIMALEAGYYYGKPEANMGEGRQLGFYAQNVRAAIGPEAAPDPETYTVTDEDGVETIKTKPWGYYDRSVLAVAIEAIKVQQAQITALTARIAALENK